MSNSTMTLQQALANLDANNPRKTDALKVLANELLPSSGENKWSRLAARVFHSSYGQDAREDMALDVLSTLLLRFAKTDRGYTTDNARAYLRRCIVHEAQRASKREARHQKGREDAGTSEDGQGFEPLDNVTYEDLQNPEEHALLMLGEQPNIGNVARASGLAGATDWVEQLLIKAVIPTMTRSDTRQNTRDALEAMLVIRREDASQRSLVLANNPGMTEDHEDFEKELNTLQQQFSRARKYLLRGLDASTPEALGITEAEFDFVYAFVADL